MNRSLPISIPEVAIADFCRRHRLRSLSLFGSVLRRDFTPKSDLDVLVEFEQGCEVGLISFMGLQRELSAILGRQVNLNTSGDLSKYFVDEVLKEAVPVYVAA